MSAARSATIVLRPDVAFDCVRQAMAELGWQPSAAKGEPLLPGEPELASWTRPSGEGRASYSFNPVVRLRVLNVEGADAPAEAGRLRDRIDCVDGADLAELLGSDSPTEQLLGLFATAEVKAVGLLGAVNALRVHSNRRVSEAAARTAEKLSLALVELGAEQLSRERTRHPGRSVVFPRLGDAATRRDIVCWLARDAAPSDDTAKTLRTALEDPDWRVRMAAIVATARLNLSPLWLDVKRAALPPGGPAGLGRNYRSLATAVQKAALERLAGQGPPSGADDRAVLYRRLHRFLSGIPDDLSDDVAQFLDGLIRPSHD